MFKHQIRNRILPPITTGTLIGRTCRTQSKLTRHLLVRKLQVDGFSGDNCKNLLLILSTRKPIVGTVSVRLAPGDWKYWTIVDLPELSSPTIRILASFFLIFSHVRKLFQNPIFGARPRDCLFSVAMATRRHAPLEPIPGYRVKRFSKKMTLMA